MLIENAEDIRILLNRKDYLATFDVNYKGWRNQKKFAITKLAIRRFGIRTNMKRHFYFSKYIEIVTGNSLFPVWKMLKIDLADKEKNLDLYTKDKYGDQLSFLEIQTWKPWDYQSVLINAGVVNVKEYLKNEKKKVNKA
jgi:hypothetical protein